MRRRWRAFVLAALLCSGGFALGKGTYVYAKAELAQYLIARAWADAGNATAAHPPWPWADTYPIARLRVPARGIETFVLEGAHGQALAFGPGRLSASAALGAAGNSVVAGHRDTHFRFLAALEPGDVILVDLPTGRTVRYAVERAYVTHEHDVAPLQQTRAEPVLTLITCYPFDALRAGGPLRYIVEASAT
jgi:sortase A